MNNPRRIQFANGNVTEYISSAGTKLCATSRTLSAGVLSPITGVMQQSSAVSPRDGEIHFTYYCGNVIYDGNVTRKEKTNWNSFHFNQIINMTIFL